jgi:hypothetical protein
MAYTPDAMMSILQKVDTSFQTGITSYKLIKPTFSNIDEFDCYQIARSYKYFLTDISKNLLSGLTVAGRNELNKLTRIKKAEDRQDWRDAMQARVTDIEAENYKINHQRNHREWWLFFFNGISLLMSFASLCVSIVAVYIAILALRW